MVSLGIDGSAATALTAVLILAFSAKAGSKPFETTTAARRPGPKLSGHWLWSFRGQR